MRPKKILIILVIMLLFSGCFNLKPESPTVDAYIEQNINDFETALKELDYEKLQELLADELMLDYESISKNDLDKIIEFFGDFDTIDTAVLTELERSILDNTVVIDAELYLELIKNQEKYIDTKTLNIIIENLGNKWTGDKWLIKSIISYTSGNYQYRNPAVNPDELLDRFSDIILNKAFYELPDLLAYTLVTSDGTTVNYYRNNQQFIALLSNDVKDITINAVSFQNRHFSLEPSGIQAAADLEVTLVIDGIEQSKSTPMTFTLIEIPEGLVINRLLYKQKFFGLL